MNRLPVAITFEPRRAGASSSAPRAGAITQWGAVLAWEPPGRLRCLWHPFFDRAEATEVEVTFVARRDGTAVRLEQRGFERLGEHGPPRRARTGQMWGAMTAGFARALAVMPAERRVRCGTEQHTSCTKRNETCTIPDMERLNITLDDEQAAKLSRLADRLHLQAGTVARSLLSTAIDEADPDAGHHRRAPGRHPRCVRASSARTQAGPSRLRRSRWTTSRHGGLRRARARGRRRPRRAHPHPLPPSRHEVARRAIVGLAPAAPLMGPALAGRWEGFRFLLGPWRWLVLVYVYIEPDDRVVVVTVQDARSSTAATVSR